MRGRYGEFKVLVDGKTLIDGGKPAPLGVLPSSQKVLAAVREALRVNNTGIRGGRRGLERR